MKRFWKMARAEARSQGWGIALDTRVLRSPARAELILPSRALAEAVAEEWAAGGAEIDPAAMPLTRAANTALDRVSLRRTEVVAAIAAYGETDLLCYRAAHPEGLVAAQASAWDPILDWLAEALGARLTRAEGVMFAPQPPEALANLTAAVEAHGPWELTALHDLVTLSGSLGIGLAVSHRRLSMADAWSASRVDEDWNIREWGEDAEAARLAGHRAAQFDAAARFLSLVRAG